MLRYMSFYIVYQPNRAITVQTEVQQLTVVGSRQFDFHYQSVHSRGAQRQRPVPQKCVQHLPPGHTYVLVGPQGLADIDLFVRGRN